MAEEDLLHKCTGPILWKAVISFFWLFVAFFSASLAFTAQFIATLQSKTGRRRGAVVASLGVSTKLLYARLVLGWVTGFGEYSTTSFSLLSQLSRSYLQRDGMENEYRSKADPSRRQGSRKALRHVWCTPLMAQGSEPPSHICIEQGPD